MDPVVNHIFYNMGILLVFRFVRIMRLQMIFIELAMGSRS